MHQHQVSRDPWGPPPGGAQVPLGPRICACMYACLSVCMYAGMHKCMHARWVDGGEGRGGERRGEERRGGY